jgi:signal transduction histidine kinase
MASARTRDIGDFTSLQATAGEDVAWATAPTPHGETPALDAALKAHHRTATETLLARARLLTAILMLSAMAVGAGRLHTAPALWILAAYVAYAASLLIVLRVRAHVITAAKVVAALHLVDLAWAAAASALSGGLSSHVFPLFAFVLVGSAYRWGLRRTLIDAGIIATIAVAESLPAVAGVTPWEFELDWFVLWVGYIFVLAVLFGGLSQRMHVLGFHAVALGQIMSRVGQATDLVSAIGQTLREVLRLFDARAALLVLEERESRRLILWRAEPRPEGLAAVLRQELPASERGRWFFPLPPGLSACEVRPGWGGADPSVTLAFDREAAPLTTATALPAGLAQDWEWQTLLLTVLESRHGWRGRLFLLDPGGKVQGALRLGFLQSVVGRVAPVIAEVYLLSGLRARAESGERARLSRELHDGVIQSLVGLEMRLEIVRRRAAALDLELTADVANVRDLLHEEALRVGELMQRMRQYDLDHARLPHALGDLLDRFSRDAGIEARLDWALLDLELTPRQCREVLRIVQEALVNVRRHSGAGRVRVRLDADASSWGITIEDDGRGLGFTGRLEHEQLEAQQKGPRVIRERAAALGGRLRAASSPAGTRLEVIVPAARE